MKKEKKEIINKLKKDISENKTKKIFISGSMSIKSLPNLIIKTLEIIKQKDYKILVGDAPGIDGLIQDFFCKEKYFSVFVYSIEEPRILKSFNFKNIKVKIDENIKDLRERQTQKDIFMTNESDISLVIWDGESKGSFNNIMRLLENNKEIQVFFENKFIEKENLKKDFIENIYKNNHKYSLSEYLKEEKENLKIKDIKKMKNFLIENKFITEKDEIIDSNGNIGKKVNRGNNILIYKKAFLDELFLKKEKSYEQESLF